MDDKHLLELAAKAAFHMPGIRGGVAEDLTGQRFRRLTVLRRDLGKTKRVYWVCRCDCGTIKSIVACDLKRPHTISCGCVNDAVRRIKALKHGFNRTPTYVTWCAMHARCTNSKLKSFKDYGGRGIRVCDRWKDFANFLADMGERPTGRSIDRIDVNGNYEPDNCRWATASEQRRNQRPVRAAAAMGERLED